MRSICQTDGGDKHPPDPLAAEVVELVVEEVAESMAGATDPSVCWLRHKLPELAASPLSSQLASPVTARTRPALRMRDSPGDSDAAARGDPACLGSRLGLGEGSELC